jgi:hypothetical protein
LADRPQLRDGTSKEAVRASSARRKIFGAIMALGSVIDSHVGERWTSRRLERQATAHRSPHPPWVRAVVGGLTAAVGVLFGLDWDELRNDG